MTSPIVRVSTAKVPTVCPYCRQPLTNQSALRALRESQEANERRLHAIAKTEARRLAEQQLHAARAGDAEKRRADAKTIQGLQAQLKELVRKNREGESKLRSRLAKEAEQEAARKLDKQLRSAQQALERQIQKNNELERRLERLSAPDRGALTEEDLTLRLKQAFIDDEIERRGRGGDILHRVRYRAGSENVEAGLIVYECKDTLRWSKDFLAQVRAASELHRTPYAIVITQAFPPKQKEIFVSADGTIVVHPNRLVDLVSIVRRMVIEVHRTGLTAQGQAKKNVLIQKYLTSEDFRQNFNAVVAIGDQMRSQLQKERSDHNRFWGQREAAYNEMSEKMAGIDQRIRDIIERPTENDKAKVVRLGE